MGPRPGGCFFFPAYVGGGCLSALLAPVICLVVAVLLVVMVVIGGFGSLVRGGEVQYSETKMQDYAMSQYQQVFDPNSATYEDNVLVVLALNEDMTTYYCIGIVGDNLKTNVNELFGNEYTALGKAVTSSINASGYKYSLGSNLAAVTQRLQASVEELGEETVYNKQKAESHTAGTVYNRSATAEFNPETVNDALKDFTAATDMNLSIVVADSVDVFGKTMSSAAIAALIISILLIVWAVITIVRYARSRKENADNWR